MYVLIKVNCLKSPTGRVANITTQTALNTCSRVLSNSLESIQSLLSCLVAVVCLVEVVLLLFSEEHRLHHLPSLRFLASVAMRVTGEKRISSKSPSTDSFLYALRTYVWNCGSVRYSASLHRYHLHLCSISLLGGVKLLSDENLKDALID